MTFRLLHLAPVGERAVFESFDHDTLGRGIATPRDRQQLGFDICIGGKNP
jgi:hypothetical protein